MRPSSESRRSRVLVLVLALALAMPAWANAPAAGRPLLLKVTAPATVAREALAAAGGGVVQELGSCLLARVDPAALSRLRAAGLACEPLAVVAADASYFLLHAPQAGPPSIGAAGVRAFAVEAGIWLLEVRDPGFRSRLVQPFRLQALWPDEELSPVAPGPGPAGERAARPLQAGAIAPLVAAVSADRLRADIQSLQDFQTRYASTAQCEAAGDFLLRRFQELGLQAYAEPFTFETRYQSRNIVALIPGQSLPGQVVLACAHYDSTSNTPLVSAPGADDNASGTAAILEMARILAGARFDFTIVLLCASAEEWGLYGSAHYARRAKAEGKEIVGVVNLDMIAYPGPNQRVLDVIGNNASAWLADRFIAAARPYVGLRLDKVINASLTWSDHSSFWAQGYAALCGIEDSDNPYYHRSGDTVSTLDLGFAADATRAAVAAVADLAQPLSVPTPPSGLTARSQVMFSLFASSKTVCLDWRASAGSVAGYHVYRALESHGSYDRLTAQPLVANAFSDRFLVSGQSYYYVVTAVDREGRESNYSLEVRDDEND